MGLKRTYVLISLLAVVLLIHLLFINVNVDNYYWDEVVFLHLVENINDGSYSSDIGENYRPPLFPFLLSYFPLNYVPLFLFFLVVLSTVAVFLLGREMYNVDVGLIAALLFVNIPVYFFYSLKILAEPLVIIFLTLGMACLYKYEKTLSPIFVYLTAACAGLAFLTKYQAGIFVGAVAIYLLTKKFRREFILATAVFLVTISPLFVLSYATFGDPFAMVISNLLEHTTPNGTFTYYFAQLPTVFGLFIAVMLLYGLCCDGNKTPLLLFMGLYFLFLLALSQKYERFLVLLFPFVAVLAARGVYEMETRWNVGTLFLVGWIVVTITLSIGLLEEDAHNTSFLIYTAEDLDLDGTVLTNSPAYFLYFGGLDAYNFPKWHEDISAYDFYILDSYHPRDDDAYSGYVNYIKANKKLLYQLSDGRREIVVYGSYV